MTPICLSHLMVFSRVILLRFHRCTNLKAVRKFRCVRRILYWKHTVNHRLLQRWHFQKSLRLAVSQIRIFFNESTTQYFVTLDLSPSHKICRQKADFIHCDLQSMTQRCSERNSMRAAFQIAFRTQHNIPSPPEETHPSVEIPTGTCAPSSLGKISQAKKPQLLYDTTCQNRYQSLWHHSTSNRRNSFYNHM